MISPFNIFKRPDYKIEQVSTHHLEDGKPKDWYSIPTKSTLELCELKGPGIITNIWLTIGPRNIFQYLPGRYKGFNELREVRLKIFFDGASEPQVDARIDEFFGCGFSKFIPHESIYVGMTSGGFYSNFLMPFARSAKVVIENTGKKKVNLFYANVTYAKLMEYYDLPQFYAYSREEDTKKGAPYLILEEEGEGYFVGVTLNMKGKRWMRGLAVIYPFLEGNLKIFIDGSEEPNLEYTGTEDYFLGGWYFVKGTFSTLYAGCTYKSWIRRKVSAYRFHDPPIPFKKSIKVIIHHGEFDEIPSHYSSVAYYYKFSEKR